MFLSKLTKAELKRWDELLSSGLETAQARDAFRPELCARRLSAPLLETLVRLATEQGEEAIRSAINGGDAYEYRRNEWSNELLIQHYWEGGPYDSEVLDCLEDKANGLLEAPPSGRISNSLCGSDARGENGLRAARGRGRIGNLVRASHESRTPLGASRPIMLAASNSCEKYFASRFPGRNLSGSTSATSRGLSTAPSPKTGRARIRARCSKLLQATCKAMATPASTHFPLAQALQDALGVTTTLGADLGEARSRG